MVATPCPNAWLFAPGQMMEAVATPAGKGLQVYSRSIPPTLAGAVMVGVMAAVAVSAPFYHAR